MPAWSWRDVPREHLPASAAIAEASLADIKTLRNELSAQLGNMTVKLDAVLARLDALERDTRPGATETSVRPAEEAGRVRARDSDGNGTMVDAPLPVAGPQPTGEAFPSGPRSSAPVETPKPERKWSDERKDAYRTAYSAGEAEDAILERVNTLPGPRIETLGGVSNWLNVKRPRKTGPQAEPDAMRE